MDRNIRIILWEKTNPFVKNIVDVIEFDIDKMIRKHGNGLKRSAGRELMRMLYKVADEDCEISIERPNN